MGVSLALLSVVLVATPQEEQLYREIREFVRDFAILEGSSSAEKAEIRSFSEGRVTVRVSNITGYVKGLDNGADYQYASVAHDDFSIRWSNVAKLVMVGNPETQPDVSPALLIVSKTKFDVRSTYESSIMGASSEDRELQACKIPFSKFSRVEDLASMFKSLHKTLGLNIPIDTAKAKSAGAGQ